MAEENKESLSVQKIEAHKKNYRHKGGSLYIGE